VGDIFPTRSARSTSPLTASLQFSSMRMFRLRVCEQERRRRNNRRFAVTQAMRTGCQNFPRDSRVSAHYGNQLCFGALLRNRTQEADGFRQSELFPLTRRRNNRHEFRRGLRAAITRINRTTRLLAIRVSRRRRKTTPSDATRLGRRFRSQRSHGLSAVLW